MVNGEREINQGRENIKYLKLVSAGLANSRGIPAESPIFVSPYRINREKCTGCGVVYGPLVYQAGEVVEAHHFHIDDLNRGGIYFERLGKEILPAFGWLAVVEPLDSQGGTFWIGSPFGARAPKVKVKEIRAYCTESSCFEELKSGLVVYSRTLSELRPLCDTDQHPEFTHDFKLNFKIEEGQVLFSEL